MQPFALIRLPTGAAAADLCVQGSHNCLKGLSPMLGYQPIRPRQSWRNWPVAPAPFASPMRWHLPLRCVARVETDPCGSQKIGYVPDAHQGGVAFSALPSPPKPHALHWRSLRAWFTVASRQNPSGQQRPNRAARKPGSMRMQMAGSDSPTLDRHARRSLGGTDIHGERTPRPEPAPTRWVQQAR